MTEGWDATGLLEKYWDRVGGRDKLAIKTGIQPGTLSGYNTGRLQLGMKNARRIAAALDVTVFDLGAPEADADDVEAQTVLTHLARLEGEVVRQAKTILSLTRRLRAVEAQLRAAQPRPGTQPRAPGGQG